MILVRETSREPEFSGESLAVVDGQQRITTLALFACALTEVLRRQQRSADLSHLHQHLVDWVSAEIDYRLDALCACVVGKQTVSFSETHPFPRIVRSIDTRGKSAQKAKYVSPIGVLLDRFAKAYALGGDSFGIEVDSQSDATESRLNRNYKTVKELVGNLNEGVMVQKR